MRTLSLGVALAAALLAAARLEAVSPSELDALNQFYQVLDGPHWLDSSGWTSGDPCTWHGVGCVGGNVVQLRLPGNRLRGSLGDLTKFAGLTSLGQLELFNDLSLARANWNALTGPMPPGFGGMTNLFYVDLRFNAIADTLDVFVPLTGLQYLALEENLFAGTTPTGLGQLVNLTLLTLNGNRLTGPIPAELGQLTKLTKLWLYNNALDSEIPPALGNLVQLTELRLGGNNLQGSIPGSLGALSQLQRLELGLANLSGPLPGELAGLHQLQILSLGTNRLTGGLDAVDWSQLTSLQEVYLDMNLLEGHLPASLATAPSLAVLRLRGNGFVGAVPDSVVSLAQHAREVDLRWNALDPSAAKTSILDRLSQGQFSSTQTVSPRGVLAVRSVVDGRGGTQANPAFVTWTPIPFVAGSGGYRVAVTYELDGSPVSLTMTLPGKEQAAALVSFPAGSQPLAGVPVTVSVTAFSEPNAFNIGHVESAPGAPVAVAVGTGAGEAVFLRERFALRSGDVLAVPVPRVGGAAGVLKTIVSAKAVTARRNDFRQPQPARLSWGNGDASERTVQLSSVADNRQEPTRTLSLVLASPAATATAAVELAEQTVAGTAADPVIATNSHGVSFAVWTQPQSNSTLRDVLGRFLDAAGKTLGGVLPVAVDPNLDEYDPAVVALDDDSFLVAWIEGGNVTAKPYRLCRALPGANRCAIYSPSTAAQESATGLALSSAGGEAWVGWTTADGYFAQQVWPQGAGIPQVVTVGTATVGTSFAEPALAQLGPDQLLAAWTAVGTTGPGATIGGQIVSQTFSSAGRTEGGLGTQGGPQAAFQRHPTLLRTSATQALLAWNETDKLVPSGDQIVAWTVVDTTASGGSAVQRAGIAGTELLRLVAVAEATGCRLLWLSGDAGTEQIEGRVLPGCGAVGGDILPPIPLNLTEGTRESFAATSDAQGVLLVEQLVAERGVRWLRTGRPPAL
jgi:Leucine-rich repeat (LRR) protein